jgi:hypothetical protein
MCFLAPDLLDIVPPEQKAEAEGLVKALEAFGEQVRKVGATGSVEAFVDLCLPQAVLVGRYGDGGKIAAIRASDLAWGLPKRKVTAAPEPNRLLLVGPGCAWIAATETVQAEGEQPCVVRHAAIACYLPAEGGCKIIAGTELPVPE